MTGDICAMDNLPEWLPRSSRLPLGSALGSLSSRPDRSPDYSIACWRRARRWRRGPDASWQSAAPSSSNEREMILVLKIERDG